MRTNSEIKMTRLEGKLVLEIPLTKGMKAIIDREDFDTD